MSNSGQPKPYMGFGHSTPPPWYLRCDNPSGLYLVSSGRHEKELRQPVAVATVYSAAYAGVHERFLCARLPRLEVISVKARCRAFATGQPRSRTTRSIVLRANKQPRELMRVRTRASAIACIDHVTDMISAVATPVAALREGDPRG